MEEDYREKTLGWTKLHCSVEAGNLDLANTLLNAQSNPNAIDNFNRTALSIAASRGHLALVQLLLRHGADVGIGFPLHYSCEKGHLEIIQHLIKIGANVNLSKDHNYPILIATEREHVEVVKLLIEHGADLRVKNETRATALHLACETGNLQLVSLLTESGCDINAVDKFDNTPLLNCLIHWEDKPELVKFLLEKGASIEIPDLQNNTLLHFSYNATSTLHLIKSGAHVNAQNNRGETPLYNVLDYEQPNSVKVLLEHNADPNIVGNAQWTPLHLAAKEDDLNSVEELFKWKADVNAASSQNVTPLHLAVKGGHLEVARQLLQHGSLVDVPVVDVINVNSITDYFRERPGEVSYEALTPCDLAVELKHDEIAKIMIEHRTKTNGKDWPCNKIIDWVMTNNLNNIKECSLSDILQAKDLMGWSALHYSVYKHLYEMTSELVAKGVALNILDNFERSPLSVAVAKNDLKMAKLLLDSGADVNLGLPIHYATMNNSIDCLLELVQRHDCLVNIQNKSLWENTALIEAANESRHEIIKILLEHKADPNCVNNLRETALHKSCESGDLQSTRLLLKYGANVNAVDLLKDTPLFCAIAGNNSDIVKLLLEKGADINVEDSSSYTTLHRAASWNSKETTLALIKAGANVNYYNQSVEKPLYLAAENVNSLRCLIENGADVGFRTFDGWSTLHECCYSGNLDCVRELLNCKADVNGASAENVLPLYLASIRGHLEVVKELIDRGSYVNSSIIDVGAIRCDHKLFSLTKTYHAIVGNTSLIGAASKGHLEVVKLLYSSGALLECQNIEGNTALHEAVLNDSAEIVEFFIQSGININVQNAKQKTALDLAKEKLNEAIINLLLPL